MNVRTPRLAVVLPLVLLPVIAACGSRARVVVEDDAAVEGASPTLAFDEAGAPPDASLGRDPETCEEATLTRSYVGCDYYPTVTANNVWSVFDYAVVVSNTGQNVANVTVTGPNNFSKQVQVPAGELRKIYLPWVASLKGPDADNQGSATPLTASVYATGGAYHLVSSVPVIVAQFNALQYKGEGGEGPLPPDAGPDASPPAKNWSTCPGNGGVGCFSYSNDASLLLPSTALTTNVRVTGYKGWTSPEVPNPIPIFPPTC